MDAAWVLALVPFSRGWGGDFWYFLGTRPAVLLYGLLVLARVGATALRALRQAGGTLRPHLLRPLLLVIFVAATTDLLGARVLKPGFQRPRPCVAMQLDVERCSKNSWSFPSNHAASTAAVASAMASPALGAVSLLTGISRVILGQHYPSDVAAGWLLGAGLGALMRRLWHRWLPEDLWK